MLATASVAGTENEVQGGFLCEPTHSVLKNQ